MPQRLLVSIGHVGGSESHAFKFWAGRSIEDGAGTPLSGLPGRQLRPANCVGQRHVRAHGLGLIRLLVQWRIRDACTHHIKMVSMLRLHILVQQRGASHHCLPTALNIAMFAHMSLDLSVFLYSGVPVMPAHIM